MPQTDYHRPVLLAEAVDGLITDENGIYIDGTLGGGGHSSALLARLGKKAKVYGFDQDDEAHTASIRLKNETRFIAINGNFGFMDTLLPFEIHGKVSGILLDLGVSSHQIDEPGRGFSFQSDGPMDMRMNPSRAFSASDVVNEYPEERLKQIFYTYGEERFSGKIALAVINARPITSTFALRDVILGVVKGPHAIKSIARIFQAVRIEVNQELEMLKQALIKGLKLLAPGGRFVVISYHSLEDRLVKHFFRSGNFEGKVEKDFYGNDISPIRPVHSGAIMADDNEIRVNSRARSARLRIAEKLKEAA